MYKYCILGGGGSFGLHCSKYLLENFKDIKVIGVGRNFLREGPFSLNITKFKNYKYYAKHIYHEQDLLLETLEIEKPDIIINFAAQGEGAVSWKHSWRFFETNSVALSKLCENLIEKKWLKRFVHIGTSEMYGSVTKPSKENDKILPSSPYASSKVAFDLYLISISKYLNFPMNIIRPSNAYCSGQLLHRIIPKTIVSGLVGNKVPLHGGGKAEKSYIHAKDLARAIYLISNKAPLGKVYNVGPDNPTSIRKVVELCAKKLNIKFEDLCKVSEDRLGQDSKYWLDSSEVLKDVGWKQEIFWDEGLQEVLEWAKENIDFLKSYPMDYQLRA